MLGANLNFQQAKNNTSDIQYNQHNYSTVLNAMINPNKYWGLDMAYNYDAIQQNMFLCFAGTVTPSDTTTCAEDPTLLQTYGFYQTHTQFGYFALTLTPIERVTMRFGYNIVDNQGNTTSLNTLLPLGPLSSIYQSPLAAVDVLVHKERHLQSRLELLPVWRRLIRRTHGATLLPRQQHNPCPAIRLLEGTRR